MWRSNFVVVATNKTELQLFKGFSLAESFGNGSLKRVPNVNIMSLSRSSSPSH